MPKEKKKPKFCNVALLPEDHDCLRELADADQRTMTRQLSVIIRKEYANLYTAQEEPVTV